MKRFALLLAVSGAACGGSHQPAPQSVDAPVGSVAAPPPATLPPPDAPRVNRFPGGPGVTLVSDDLDDLTHDPRFTAKGVTGEERMALAREKFGIDGTPEKDAMFDGLSWVAVGARSIAGPVSCEELIVSKSKPGAIAYGRRPADHRRCGLPYLPDSTKQYRGNGPRWTDAHLRLMLVEIQGMDPLNAELTLRKKLGFPEGTSQPPEWIGVGPRGRDAPITCHVLLVGTPAKVFEAPLERCGIAWPPPAERFDPGPQLPPIDKEALAKDCQAKCSSTEMCMLTQKNPPGASLRPESDGLHGRYADGRPAKVEITQACVPIPASCSPITASCFFTPPPPGTPPGTSSGPCPKDDFGGYSFTGAPPHIECYQRYKAAP